MNTHSIEAGNIPRDRIFKGICLALLPTAFTFVLVSNILQQLKTEFLLTNVQVGYIGGAAFVLALIYLGVYINDRRQGGYKVKQLNDV